MKNLVGITDFRGRAIVFGATREVVYAQNNLLLCGLTYDEVMSVLDFLGGYSPDVAHVPVVPKADIDISKLPTKAPDKLPVAVSLPPMARPLTAGINPVAEAMQEAADRRSVTEPPVPPTVGSPAADPGSTQLVVNDLPEKVLAASQLRDVVGWLIDGGCTDPDVLVKRCTEMRDQVPVLQRIANLDERVRRSAQLLGVGV